MTPFLFKLMVSQATIRQSLTVEEFKTDNFELSQQVMVNTNLNQDNLRSFISVC